MFHRTNIVVTLILCFAYAVSAFGQAEPGLVGYWNFDNMTDGKIPDLSNSGNLGRDYGATQVKRGYGYALRFDGVNDYVDCGNGPSLNLKEAVTVSAWVFPEVRPMNEPGLVMKQDVEVYGLTMYKDGRCWWYISSGGNKVKSGLGTGAWRHVVGTYDGKEMKLYIDGKMRDSRKLSVPIKQGGNLLIGKRGTYFFRGMIDEVKVYNRALSADKVFAQYKAVAKEFLAKRLLPRVPDFLRGKGFLLRVGRNGGMQIEIGEDIYFVESSFSYPGRQTGYNYFSEGELKNLSAWKPPIRLVTDSAVIITGSGTDYSIIRRIQVKGHRILIRDTITNKSSGDIGMIIENLVIAKDEEPRARLSGVPTASSSSAENPTVLLAQKGSQVGMVAEDNISRTQFEASAAMDQAGFALRHLGLAAGKSVTLEWTLYPFEEGADYWTFINRVREDWGVNFTMIGPGNMFNVTHSHYWGVFTNPDKCAAYLKRSGVKVLALGPWLDYDNLDHRTGSLTSRDEYKKITQVVKATVKSVDPSVRIIGNIQSAFVSLPRPVVEKIYNSLPESKRKGFYEFTAAETEMLKSHPEAWVRWKDSAVMTRDGRMKFESYKRGKWPMIALTVRPVLGNGQHKYLMDQARFIIEECGLDGFYLDSFTGSKHWHYGKGYDERDCVTVVIDITTGEVVGKYTDLALTGTGSRNVLIQYGIDKGGVVVTNGHPIARETQSMQAIRFNESEWVVDVFAAPEGQKPPLHSRICQAHLASPVALGVRPDRYGEKGMRNYAKVVMLTAIHYLRHGVLYFHYRTEIPEEGPGSGEYGPFNHMYPITPRGLGEGYIVGKERIVTCVSRAFDWPGEARPGILLFDITGREKVHTMKALRMRDGWEIDVKLDDWREIAVVEAE